MEFPDTSVEQKACHGIFMNKSQFEFLKFIISYYQ